MNNKDLLKGICHYFNESNNDLVLEYEETVEEREDLDRLIINIHVSKDGVKKGRLYEAVRLLPDKDKEEVYELLRHNMLRRAAIYGIDKQIAQLIEMNKTKKEQLS